MEYFGIFSYPLNSEEIYRYCQFPCSYDEVEHGLNELIQRKKIFKTEGFYSKENKPEWTIERKKGNDRAIQLLMKIGKFVRILSNFPYVEAIAISGSLSKFYAKENTDIDYFIITSSDRLWISRSLLHFFKKLSFITGHQHYFCMNYFIDIDALFIQHRNLYSAIELVTLLPAYNEPLIKSLKEENQWIHKFLPNTNLTNDNRFLIPYRKVFIKRIAEFILNLFFPCLMNRFLMWITDKKWRYKWRHHGYSEKSYNHAFLTTLKISKNHPDDYEEKVLTALNK